MFWYLLIIWAIDVRYYYLWYGETDNSMIFRELMLVFMGCPTQSSLHVLSYFVFKAAFRNTVYYLYFTEKETGLERLLHSLPKAKQ